MAFGVFQSGFRYFGNEAMNAPASPTIGDNEIVDGLHGVIHRSHGFCKIAVLRGKFLKQFVETDLVQPPHPC